MMQGTRLWGPVRVEARVDTDGDALSKLPGDLTGGPIAGEVNKDGLQINIDTAL